MTWPPLSIHKKETDFVADLSSFIETRIFPDAVAAGKNPIVSESAEAGREREPV